MVRRRRPHNQHRSNAMHVDLVAVIAVMAQATGAARAILRILLLLLTTTTYYCCYYYYYYHYCYYYYSCYYYYYYSTITNYYSPWSCYSFCFCF